MAGFGYLCALALAAVLVWAAAAKLARPGLTLSGFEALAVPTPALLARVVPFAELATATALAALPRAGAALAILLLGAFTLVLIRAISSGAGAGCPCFGATSPRPVGAVDVVRNGLLGLLAVAAAAPSGPVRPTAGEIVMAILALGLGVTLLSVVGSATAPGRK